MRFRGPAEPGQIAFASCGPPSAGFSWGASPLFDPNKGFGVSGNAKFTVCVTKGGANLPNVVVGAWGDGKVFLDLSSRKGTTQPRAELEGKFFFGAQGTF